jgi:hypothetical protein
VSLSRIPLILLGGLLLNHTVSDLRECIGCSDAKELRRFGQVTVNSVIATDIIDIDLKIHRDKAAGGPPKHSEERLHLRSFRARQTVSKQRR